MSWDSHVDSMKAHGACHAGIYDIHGNCWAQSGLEGMSKEEVLKLVENIKSGKWEMSVSGKGCVVMKSAPGSSLTGKAKSKEGEPRPLYHAVMGKNQCMYIIGCEGHGERSLVFDIEDKFAYLKEY